MGVFIPMDSYRVILEEVSRFKVIGLKKLYEIMQGRVSYSFFCRQVRKLEEESMLTSILGPRKLKFITLTDYGSKFTSQAAQYSESDLELNHDLVCSNVVVELNKLKPFYGGHVLHAGEQHHEIEADGLIYFINNGQTYSLSLEVELTQKAKPRISQKYIKYKRADCFNYCLYLFDKKRVFEVYKVQLNQKIEAITRKIILMYSPNLSINSFDMHEGLFHFKNKDHTYEELFCKDHQLFQLNTNNPRSW